MPEMQLYEYAVIRYLPRVEREEFVNVGLAMMCKRKRWLKLRVHIDADRIRAFMPQADILSLERQLRGFQSIADGESGSGPIGEYPAEERFRWLTAAKSCCIQAARPHPGLTEDLEATFDRLFAELVL